jgi:hypothetical protein
MADAACEYCGLTEDVQKSAFTGEPICAECARIQRIPTGPLIVNDVETVIRDAVTEDAPGYEEREIQEGAITRLAELIVAQSRRIEALEKALADRTTEK